jgi:hypothetical protein
LKVLGIDENVIEEEPPEPTVTVAIDSNELVEAG